MRDARRRSSRSGLWAFLLTPLFFAVFPGNYQRVTARERQKSWAAASTRSEKTAAIVAVLDRFFAVLGARGCSAAGLARAGEGKEIRINPLKVHHSSFGNSGIAAGRRKSADPTTAGRRQSLQPRKDLFVNIACHDNITTKAIVNLNNRSFFAGPRASVTGPTEIR